MKRKTKSAPVKSQVWRTFLKINSMKTGDLPPECDSAYLVSKGIEPESPIVLGLIRDHVIPLFDEMGNRGSSRARAPTPRSDWGDAHLLYRWFLVHNRESGVPTTEDDKACYLDITLVFTAPCYMTTASPFVMTTPSSFEAISKPSGWDHDALLSLCIGGHPNVVMRLLDIQSSLITDFINAHKRTVSNFTLMKHYRQYCHYFANIGQMRIS